MADTLSRMPRSRVKPIDPVASVAHLRAAAPRLGEMIARVGPFRLPVSELQSPYEALFESIVYQQLTGKAAATIVGRLRDALGGGAIPSAERVAAATEEELRAHGLSKAKAESVKDLAARMVAGELPTLDALHDMRDEVIVKRLDDIRGVGAWTVEMLLIFRLGRPDVLPSGDYGIRKGFAKTFGRRDLPTPAQVAARGERWRPWRTVASWYLWRSLEVDIDKAS